MCVRVHAGTRGELSAKKYIWPRRLPKSVVTVLRGMHVISPALVTCFGHIYTLY